jgi:anti-sigma factor RsiW
MNSDTQLRVQSYLDNELSPGEARKMAEMLSSDREAQDLYNHLRMTRQLLRANQPELKLEESRDFYWSKIQRQIESTPREPAPQPPASLWIRLLAPLAGTAALFALLLSVMNNPQSPIGELSGESLASAEPLHGEVEDLAPEMSSVTFRSEESGVTVVWLSARE